MALLTRERGLAHANHHYWLVSLLCRIGGLVSPAKASEKEYMEQEAEQRKEAAQRLER